MNAAQSTEAESIETDTGYFHLSETGWIRQDHAPFPNGRLETWQYDMERPAADAKQQVKLTRVWIAPGLTDERSAALYKQFGDAVTPNHDRHVVIDCWA